MSPTENEQEPIRKIAAPADFKTIATVDDFVERMQKQSNSEKFNFESKTRLYFNS